MKTILITLLLVSPAAAQIPDKPAVVFQPSHQSDTGENYNEALTCDAIVQYAMHTPPYYDEHKVWSYFQPGLHHADTGTNTLKAHTTALENGKLSGYAWELQRSNEIAPVVFIGVHNNGGTNRHAVWGYIHDGDALEAQNRRLSDILIEEIARATDLENRGTHLDSSTGRNDYRCAATGRLAFYSVDENVNRAPYRVLLEIGDIDKSRSFLLDEGARRAIGAAIKKGLQRFLEGK
ncbi:MAG: hypothetical protein A2049_12675 [Elusimicrobia bacterium GWA2_62_23]|nr:MAG: hypothetical protein A2049_12675 [Elusimicrobia bacterium GWA2_62_23]OGR73395.1 MAG: hypothetical protein A2179_02560 [Elusimicrobia bacterium GWC2_63_65]